MNQYPQPQSGASPTLGIVSLVFGAFGLCLLIPTLIFWFCGIFPFLLGVAAVIIGFLGISRVKKDPARYSGKGLAIAGILAGVVAIILPTLYGILSLGLIAYRFSTLK